MVLLRPRVTLMKQPSISLGCVSVVRLWPLSEKTRLLPSWITSLCIARVYGTEAGVQRLPSQFPRPSHCFTADLLGILSISLSFSLASSLMSLKTRWGIGQKSDSVMVGFKGAEFHDYCRFFTAPVLETEESGNVWFSKDGVLTLTDCFLVRVHVLTCWMSSFTAWCLRLDSWYPGCESKLRNEQIHVYRDLWLLGARAAIVSVWVAGLSDVTSLARLCL